MMSEKKFWCRLFFRIEMKEKMKKMREELLSNMENEKECMNINGDDGLTEEELKALEEISSDEDWSEWE